MSNAFGKWICRCTNGENFSSLPLACFSKRTTSGVIDCSVSFSNSMIRSEVCSSCGRDRNDSRLVGRIDMDSSELSNDDLDEEGLVSDDWIKNRVASGCCSRVQSA